MSGGEADVKRFLVEWYGPQTLARSIGETVDRLNDRAASMSTGGKRVRLLTAIAVPDDDYAFGVFAADSADLVTQVCHDAGAPAERISPAVGWMRAQD
ncbi:hypothetical protein AWC19_05075 [Mycobacterium palustre]|uniref:DUF4242 domain-containing protein n=2 Tax=Mycobacterium palustre TaxID=153971 RepID=A0A1X1ZS14_9MYCO|nr:hypothetical protein AWC19_05075 [Mycobacterium palustre]